VVVVWRELRQALSVARFALVIPASSLGRLPRVYSHASKHSKVVRGPYVAHFFVAHDDAVFDRAGTIEAWFRDENVIDAAVWPRRPCGKVIAPSPRCSFAAIARLVPPIAPIGAASLERLQSFEVANFRGFRIGIEVADQNRGKIVLGSSTRKFVKCRHLSLALVSVVCHVK
jgi:hypothetical protein